MKKEITAHPLAEMLPMMDGREWEVFVQDVRTNGIQHPIVMLDGQILDGRNRFKASQELAIPCPTVEFDGTDPLGYVMSSNLHRRHLTTKQRAAIAAEMATMEHGSNRYEKKVEGSNELSIEKPAMTINQAASALNVSENSVKRAKQVMREDPEAHEVAKRGEKVNKEKAPKAEKFKGVLSRFIDAGLVGATEGSSRNKVYAVAWERLGWQAMPKPAEMDSEKSEALDNVIAIMVQEKNLKQTGKTEQRPEVLALPKTDKKKLDQAIKLETARLHAEFNAAVRAEFERRNADMVESLTKARAQFVKDSVDHANALKGIRPLITETEYKTVLSFCHPDKHVDPEMKARANRVFDIVRQLDPYVEAIKRKKAA